MIYTVPTTHPSEPTRSSLLSVTQYWQVSEAKLVGERIDAKLTGTGGDWMRMTDDGFWRPDVRAQFMTTDGAVILMHYTGLVEQTARFRDAATRNEPTDWDDQYMRLAIDFNTGDDRYAWLTQSLFVPAGRLLGTGAIEYDVRRVT
jgi:hypothetical protein